VAGVDRDTSASQSAWDSDAPDEAATPSPARTQAAIRIATRLPRPETACLLFALFCTIVAKLITVRRHFPEDLPAAWLTVVAPDFLFFAALVAMVSLGYRLQPRRSVARLALVLAVSVLIWSLLNAAWLLATGVQLQPSILPALGYDPRQFAGIIEAYVLRYWPMAIGCGVVVLALVGWIVFRLARPVAARSGPRRLLGPLVAVALIVPTTWAVGRVAAVGSDLTFETRAALGFSSHY
jgi:hypothetical protein